MAFSDKEIRAARQRRASKGSANTPEPKRLIVVPKPEDDDEEDLIVPPPETDRPCPECGEMMLQNQANCTSCGYFEGEVISGAGRGLTQAERQVIYEEEKAKVEARKQLEAKQKAQGCLMLLLLFFGFWLYLKLPHETEATRQKSDQVRKDMESRPHPALPQAFLDWQARQGKPLQENPIASFSAPDLFARYEENEVAADQQYKGKILEVHGTVDAIGKDILNHPYVTFSIGQAYKIGRVQCFFSDADIPKLAKISKGAEIRIRGRCKGKMGNVLLDECALGYPYGS